MTGKKRKTESDIIDPDSRENSTRSTHNNGIAKTLAVAIAIIVCVAVVVGAYLGSLALNPSTHPTVTPTTSPSPPDLQVWKIETNPSQPREQEVFQYSVWMVNNGETKSGWYDLNIAVMDKTHGGHYSNDPIRLGPLDPTSANQAVLVFTGDCQPNDPGLYEIFARIVPVDFQDGNTGNNDFTSQSFSVLSGVIINP